MTDFITLLTNGADTSSLKGIWEFTKQLFTNINVGSYLPLGCTVAVSICLVLAVLHVVKSYVPFT